jgi:hypothetical protein
VDWEGSPGFSSKPRLVPKCLNIRNSDDAGGCMHACMANRWDTNPVVSSLMCLLTAMPHFKACQRKRKIPRLHVRKYFFTWNWRYPLRRSYLYYHDMASA